MKMFIATVFTFQENKDIFTIMRRKLTFFTCLTAESQAEDGQDYSCRVSRLDMNYPYKPYS